ncbi:hypothetical protein ANTRET_LOCUS9892 [Anthophora retusa]
MATENVDAHIRDLKTKRRLFKGQVTQFGKWVESYKDSTKERVKLRERITRLRNQFETFNRVQDELSSVGNFEDEESERQLTTDHYDDVMATAVVCLEELETRAAPSSPRSHISTQSSSPYALSVNLPKIDLPKFDGRIEMWITFKDAFHTLIHTQPGLNKIQKLHYLRLSLSGKAEAAIGAFSITEDNYEAAWNHLMEIYDNKRALVLRHAALLRDTPAMPDDSSDSIRELANHMQLHIRSLQAIGRSSDDIANDLLASILISKMGNDTRKSWERTLSDTEMPKIDDLFKFLHNASHQSKDYATEIERPTIDRDSLKNVSAVPPRQNNYPRTQLPPRQGNYSRTQPPPRQNNYPRSQLSPPPKRQVYVTKTSRKSPTPPSSPRTYRRSPPPERSTAWTRHTDAKCPFCEGNHASYRCPQFLEQPASSRIDAAQKARLCLNCLQSDHRTEDCKAERCRVCNKQHNTKLHREPQT